MSEYQKTYSYKESIEIMLTPYLILGCIWFPLIQITSQTITSDPLWVTLIIDLLATVIVFLFSLKQKNTSVYDPYWHIPPYFILIYFAFQVQGPLSGKNFWILLMPFLYFTRHNYNYFSFWPGMKYEDFRYIRFQKQFPQSSYFWLFSLFGLHIVPTLMVFFGLFPTWFALISKDAYNPFIFYLGVFIALGGLVFESIADHQLQPWRSRETKEFIDSGLWKYSRHPNYFGECVFWWGTLINALSFGFQLWFVSIGAIIIQCLFVFYSIPIMEKHLLAKRPTYALQVQRVSKFVPWFRNQTEKSRDNVETKHQPQKPKLEEQPTPQIQPQKKPSASPSQPQTSNKEHKKKKN